MRQYLNACNKLMSDQDDDEEMWEEAQEYWIDLIEEEGAAKMVNLAIGSLNDLTRKDKDAMTYFVQVLLMQVVEVEQVSLMQRVLRCLPRIIYKLLVH